ncbi:THAP domain-containing protein 8 [Athene noctua]|uniref:THAP domain-containing protein 8 n=1 Tax=Athene noctua TaxID=126797 RepID=UPI003EBCB0BD
MPKYCRAPHCSNAAGQARPPGRRLSFYKFPLHDTPRLRRWLAQMRREDWLPTRHQHLCSDHFEPSCFQYRWGVRYLRPDAVPTIFPCGPTKQEKLSTQQPPSGTEPVPPPQPLVPKSSPEPSMTKPGDDPKGDPGRLVTPQAPTVYFEAAATPETVVSSVLTLPVVSTVPIVSRAAPASPPGELSTEELVAVALVLQRKVKVLQQRRRRHRARLAAMEGLLEQLRRDSLVSEERLKMACLQPVTPDPTGAVTIICQEEEEEDEEEEEAALVYAGTSCGLGLAGP